MRLSRFAGVCALVVSFSLGAVEAGARATPEERCQAGRYGAATQYFACQQKQMTKYAGGHQHRREVRPGGREVRQQVRRGMGEAAEEGDGDRRHV